MAEEVSVFEAFRQGRGSVAPQPESVESWWASFLKLIDRYKQAKQKTKDKKKKGRRRREFGQQNKKETVEIAMLAGYQLADGIGYAFAAAYQCALQHLVLRERFLLAQQAAGPSPAGDHHHATTAPADSQSTPAIPWLPRSLCATEKVSGATPRSIATVLEREAAKAGAAETFRLRGRKSFVTLPSIAQELLVFAHHAEGNAFRIVSVRLPSPSLSAAGSAPSLDRQLPAGMRFESVKQPPFIPHIPHHAVVFDDLLVHSAQLWKSTVAWHAYVRPFRLIEEIHLYAAVSAHFLRVLWFILSLSPSKSAPSSTSSSSSPSSAASPAGGEVKSTDTISNLITEVLQFLSSVLGFPLWVPDLANPMVELLAAGLTQRFAQIIADFEAVVDSTLPEDHPIRSNFARDRLLFVVAARARTIRTRKAWSKL